MTEKQVEYRDQVMRRINDDICKAGGVMGERLVSEHNFRTIESSSRDPQSIREGADNARRWIRLQVKATARRDAELKQLMKSKDDSIGMLKIIATRCPVV